MDSLRYKLYKLILESDDINEAINESLDFILTLKHTLSHNNKKVTPAHDVYLSYPKNTDKKINKDIDRQARELGLKISHVGLKGPDV